MTVLLECVSEQMKVRSHFFLLLFFCCCSCCFSSSNFFLFFSEIALRNFYMATSGASWTENKNWLSREPCDYDDPIWFGVDCDDNHVITMSVFVLCFCFVFVLFTNNLLNKNSFITQPQHNNNTTTLLSHSQFTIHGFSFHSRNLAYNGISGHFPEYYGEDFMISMQSLVLMYDLSVSLSLYLSISPFSKLFLTCVHKVASREQHFWHFAFNNWISSERNNHVYNPPFSI